MNHELEPDPSRPAFRWGWIDGEGENEGDRWIQVSTLNYTKDGSATLGDVEVCILMVRNFKESVAKHPDIVDRRELQAQQIVDGLNGFYGVHEVVVQIEGGCCVDVRGLPDGWDYVIED